MLEIKDAQKKLNELLTSFCQTQIETVALTHATGRVIADDIVSSINVPPADNSAMDGYALNTSSLTNNGLLKVSQRIQAGAVSTPLARGTAARIFTGAEIPEGADAVVMQENCEEKNEHVAIKVDVKKGSNIRKCGQDIRSKQCILTKGKRIKPQDIGLIASIGQKEISVYKTVRVGILSTGDELIPVGGTLKQGQIYDSNRMMIEALCKQLDCIVVESRHVSDDLEKTVSTLNSMKQSCDIIISCGGVSVGEEDHVKAAVSKLGKLDFWKVRMKPGKPLAFGHIRNSNQDCLFLGLPGNPVSAFVSMHMFGKQIIATIQGEQNYRSKSFFVKANFTHSGKNTRPELVRVQYAEDGLKPFDNQSSGVLSSVSWADALALIPDNTSVAPGDLVEIFPL